MKYERQFCFLQEIVGFGSHKGLAKIRYVNDKQITDHYAIIPTGQGMSALSGLPGRHERFMMIVRRFYIFYPAAVYQRLLATQR